MLNVESWRRHTHGLCQEPVLINDKPLSSLFSWVLSLRNVKEWIPDMPDEYFRPLCAANWVSRARMPAPAPKSDLIRYALLYHHGGLYMDADFVAVKVLETSVSRLRGRIWTPF